MFVYMVWLIACLACQNMFGSILHSVFGVGTLLDSQRIQFLTRKNQRCNR